MRSRGSRAPSSTSCARSTGSLEKAYAKLEAELHRTPNDVELAAELGITDDQLQTMLNQISFVGLVALDEMLSVGGERGDTLSLGDTINRMPEREKIVLTLYYYEGLTLAEIGEVLGVTESRVCQIHTKAILQLRSKMTEPEREPA